MDKVLKKNFIYLFFLQNANYIIPLLLLPYLTQTLGVSNFGKISFAQAFIAYFTLITEFGFNTSSTQSIALVQNNKIAVSKVFWNTIYAKSGFAILSFIVLISFIVLFPKLKSDASLFLIAYIGVVSSVVFPTWLFQGLEKMVFITVLSVIPRMLVLIATFVFVKNPNDYLLAVQIQVGGTLATGLMSMALIYYKKMIVFIKPSWKTIASTIKDSWPIFISGFATNIYTTTNIVVLGFLTNDATVGIFSASDKIIRAVISLSSAITQVTFPRINVYFKTSADKALQFAIKILKYVGFVNLIGAVFIFALAPYIVKFMFGLPEYNETILIMRISSLMPFFAIANGIVAINIFVTFNLKDLLVKIVSLGGIFSMILIFPLTYYFQAKGVAVCALLTEIFIAVLLVVVLYKKNIKLIR